MRVIYLDNNATTRVLPEVLKAMLPFYTEFWGNPSSMHTFGSQVAKHIDTARERAATLIGAQRESEIVFTSGGTESNHLAIRGILAAHPEKRHILTTQVEHSSILMLCKQLEKEGYAVTYLGVDSNGALNLEELQNAIRSDTAMATIVWANNETGVIFPIEEISNICAAKNIPLHVDAIQAVGKIAIDIKKTNVDCLSVSGHKIHGPKGVGIFYMRRGTKWMPQIFGGHQERGRRSGTENVPGIIGLGKASQLAHERLKNNAWKKIAKLRDGLEQKLTAQFQNCCINGKKSLRLPNTTSLSFEGLQGETICLLLNEAGIATSTGSACAAGSLEPSHVLKAMGVNHKQARGTVRLSLSFETTSGDTEQTHAALKEIIPRLEKN